MDLVIFGTGQLAELAAFYFARDSAHRVVAHTVDAAHLTTQTFGGLPVLPFEGIAGECPPDRCGLFVAVGYSRMNALRRERLTAAQAIGYRAPSYVSSRATVFPDLSARQNCFILEDNTIQPFAVIGDNVVLWSGNHIGHHSVIADDVFVASHAVISGNVTIGRGSFVGVNATIRDGVTIGAECVIGAGALVLEDQPDRAVVAPRGSVRSGAPSTRLRQL